MFLVIIIILWPASEIEGVWETREGTELTFKDGSIFINGEIAATYNKNESGLWRTISMDKEKLDSG